MVHRQPSTSIAWQGAYRCMASISRQLCGRLSLKVSARPAWPECLRVRRSWNPHSGVSEIRNASLQPNWRALFTLDYRAKADFESFSPLRVLHIAMSLLSRSFVFEILEFLSLSLCLVSILSPSGSSILLGARRVS